MNESSLIYICTVLRRFGITQLRVTFSGAGDSGSIDDWDVEGAVGTFDALDKIIVTEALESVRYVQDGVEDVWRISNGVDPTLNEWIDKWVNAHAVDDSYVGFDWYNNDGGGGTITFFPFEGRYEVDGYYNVTEMVDAGAPGGAVCLDDITLVDELPFEENVDG
jgi:hypothetical protein